MKLSMRLPKIPRIKFPWQKEKPIIADFRVIFMGSGEFAAPVLKQLLDFERLLSEGKIVLAVFTQPDKPVGRNGELAPTAVKSLALKYKAPVLEPESLKSDEWVKKVKDLGPDLIIVCDYGKMIPASILNLPKFGCINIHPSLLPKYRGATPIQQAIADGAAKTGVSIMLLDEELDHGPILKQESLKVKNNDTCISLRGRLADLGARMLINFLPYYLNGKFTPSEQEHKKATITHELKKEMGKIDWAKSALEIERMIRAYSPWPGVWTLFNQRILKINQARICKGCKKLKPGKIFLTKKNELAVNCGRDGLIIEELQLEGKKAMGAQEFLRGQRNFVGAELG